MSEAAPIRCAFFGTCSSQDVSSDCFGNGFPPTDGAADAGAACRRYSAIKFCISAPLIGHIWIDPIKKEGGDTESECTASIWGSCSEDFSACMRSPLDPFILIIGFFCREVTTIVQGVVQFPPIVVILHMSSPLIDNDVCQGQVTWLDFSSQLMKSPSQS